MRWSTSKQKSPYIQTNWCLAGRDGEVYSERCKGPAMNNLMIGQRLRQLRMDRTLRQSDVAKQLGVSPAYLNLIEKGKRTIQFPLLWRALELLGQDLETFMSALGERRPDDALAKLLDDPLGKSLDLDEDDV